MLAADLLAFSYSADVRDRFMEAVVRASGGETARCDIKIKIINEQFIWVHLLINPIHDNQGKVVKLIGSAVDITERYHVQEELANVVLRLNMAVRAGNVGLWTWDLETNEVFYSREWKLQIGYEDH